MLDDTPPEDTGDFFGEVPGQLEIDFDQASYMNETAGLTAQMNELRTANQARFRELLEMRLRPDPNSVLMTRFNLLLDMMLDEHARTRFELAFETNMASYLEESLVEARKKTLLAPPTNPPPPSAGLFLS